MAYHGADRQRNTSLERYGLVPQWKLQERDGLLRLESEDVRGFGTDEFTLTWAQLFHSQLLPVRVYTLFFPSRFSLPSDTLCEEGLRAFGENTPDDTSVNFWDPKDKNFSAVLRSFDVEKPPAIILATGLRGVTTELLEEPALYSLVFTDNRVLNDREQLAASVNGARELLIRADPKEIVSFMRKRELKSLLTTIGGIAGQIRDQVLKFKPKLVLPGGASLSLG